MTVGASSSSNDTGSSGGIDLNIIDYFTHLADTYKDLISEVFEELLEDQEELLSTRAAQYSTWADLSDKIEVSYNGKYVDYNIVGSPEDHAAFTKKEYGDLFQAPHPLLRSFASRHTNDLAEKFTDKMRQALGETI